MKKIIKSFSIAATLWIGSGAAAAADGNTGTFRLGSDYLAAGIEASPPPAQSDLGLSGVRPVAGSGSSGMESVSKQAVEQVGNDLFLSALTVHDTVVRRQLTNMVKQHKDTSEFDDLTKAKVLRIEDQEVIGASEGRYRVRVSYLIMDPVRLIPLEDTFVMKLGAEGHPVVLEIIT